MKRSNTVHSIRQRLLDYAQERRENFDLVLLRYANERLLYRLGWSVEAERFLLKGATLFLLWNENQPHRPTRDVDLLAVRSEDAEQLRDVFCMLCAVEEIDGVVSDSGSVTVAPISEEQKYGGQRVSLRAELQGARISLQIDSGFVDKVTPAAAWSEVPVVLEGLDRPRLTKYACATADSIASLRNGSVQTGVYEGEVPVLGTISVAERDGVAGALRGGHFCWSGSSTGCSARLENVDASPFVFIRKVFVRSGD